jgi:uncharacterized membrane protein
VRYLLFCHSEKILLSQKSEPDTSKKNFIFIDKPISPYLTLVLAAIFGYIIGVSGLHAIRLDKLLNGFDFAFYQQAIWNTLQGRYMEVSATDFSGSLFGTDFILIYTLFVPFYALFPSPLTLVVLETVIIGLGALPIFWLACQKVNERTGLLLAIAYLALPAVMHGNLYELRERQMVVSFLLFAFWFWYNGKFALFGVAAALALACRPENGLVLIMLGVYGFWEKRHKEDWRYVWLPVVLGAVWFGVALLIIRAASQGFALGSTFAGGSPVAAVTTLFTNPPEGFRQLFPTDAVLIGKLLYLPLLLLPFLFLPLGSPRVLLMALPPAGLNFLASERRSIQWNPFDYHYQASVVPWLLVATIFTLAKLRATSYELRATNDKPFPNRQSPATCRWSIVNRQSLAVLILAITLVLNLGLNLFPPSADGLPRINNGWGAILRAKKDARIEGGKMLLAQIPPDAALVISNRWAIAVPPRRQLYLLLERDLYSLNPTARATYVFADLRNAEEATIVVKLRQSGAWETLGQQAEYILLRRNST